MGTTTQSLFICQWVVAPTTHHLVNRLNSFIVLDDDDIFEDILLVYVLYYIILYYNIMLHVAYYV